MNENLDLTKILKGCPKGTEFYSTTYGTVEFIGFDFSSVYPILMKLDFSGVGCFTKSGRIFSSYCGECTLFPSKDQRDWSKFKRFWDKPKIEKFDPKILQPFDKILIRNEDRIWYIDFFVCFDGQKCVNCINDMWDYCIPYNDDTKHLVGTKDDCPESYKWWEE